MGALLFLASQVASTPDINVSKSETSNNDYIVVGIVVCIFLLGVAALSAVAFKGKPSK